MTMLGREEAWITSAVDDEQVSKALVLAGSLRRVRTGKKLVVVTSFVVAQELREKLKEAFDLVVLIEQAKPHGNNLEEFAKMEGFSLLIFSKCVYLSPTAMVLMNCDEIFDKYDNFATLESEKGRGLDTSIFVFTPSLECSKAVRKLILHVEENGIPENFFGRWMENNFPKWGKLGKEYNFHVDLKDVTSKKSLSPNMSIVNFGELHPLDIVSAGSGGMLAGLGKSEKQLVDLCREIHEEDVKLNTNLYTDLSLKFDTYKQEPIAIVGMSFRLPGGNDVEEFWNLLINGKDGITPIPPHRWRKEHTVRPYQDKNVEAGFLTVPVDEFDANFFEYTEKQAEMMDPQFRLMHEVAWEALEDAMIDPQSLSGTQTGVFTGSWLQDYRHMEDIWDKDLVPSYLGTSIGAGAVGISRFLKVKGSNFSTESGCSSAIVAIDQACKSLRTRDSNMALACGVNLLLHPFDYNTLSFVLSPDGRCKTFDEGANGFARAEGCAALVLKRLADATRDGDNIWGLIRGSAVTQEGVSRSLGTPTIHCESLAMELALKDAGVDPLEVSYIESHGTGTPVGDPMEISAITKAYGKGRSKPLVIGSVKTNVGHTESVSGITGIIKVLLSMRNETIPKHLNLGKLNPNINLELIPASIPLEPMGWPKQPGKPRIAGVSSFGISGTDGHAIIQEPPNKNTLPKNQENFVRPLHIMKISAKAPESFQKLLSSYENLMGSNILEGELADMAYSANIGRATFNHRAVIIAKDIFDAKNSIRTKSFKYAEVKSNEAQLCLVFTGEGSNYPSRTWASLYATSPVFKDEFDKCDLLLTEKYGISLEQIMLGKSANGSDQSSVLSRMASNFCLEYCLFKLWASWGVKPEYVMGHGLGEYAAALAVGVLSLEDALMLVVERSRLLMLGNHTNDPHKMLTTYRKVAEMVKHLQVETEAPKYISGVEGKLIPPEYIDSAYWVRHSRGPTRSHNACKAIRNEGCFLFLELGPHPELSSLLVKNFEGQSMTYLPSIRKNEDEWSTMLDSLAQLYTSEWRGTVDWNGFDRGYLRSRVSLPFYPFNRKAFWKKLDDVLPIAHPLLGRPVPAATSSTIFEKRLTLKNTSFAQDHVIGNTVVFPGAGFMEMCLSGGVATSHGTSAESGELQKPQKPVALKSLRITAPLGLYESGICRLQTIIHKDKLEDGQAEVESYSVTVHRHVPSPSGGVGDWVSHSTATFLPVEETSTALKVDIDIAAIQSSWDKRDNTDFYEKLPEVGLRFGPKFRSLELGWESEKGMLITVKVPENNDQGYLIHPVVGDAMLQASMIWTNKGKPKLKLMVPAQIGKFVWLQEAASAGRFVYSSTTEEGKTICILLDEQGNQLAQMTDIDFVEVTVKLMEGLLQQQGKAMPSLWKEVWKNVPGALQTSHDFTVTKDLPLLPFEEHERQTVSEQNDIEQAEKDFYRSLCSLARLYFLNAMYELGWEPKQNVAFTTEDLVKLLPQPKEHFRRYIRYFLRSIAETGILHFTQDLDKFYFPGPPPTQPEIDEGLKNVVIPENREKIDCRLIVRAGTNLSQVLRGKVDPLEIVFPDDPKLANAAEFYIKHESWLRTNTDLVRDTIGRAHCAESYKAYMELNKVGTQPPVLRVLEVGAGTGANSAPFMAHLDRSGIPYEYYFTDISASFFNSAEKKCEKYLKNVIFRKFNIEEDALGQGFCPKYFDMIVAYEVLHIAKDIRKTMTNLKRLLKPSGIFQFVETTVQDPRITVTFGLLEGYWQFQDVDLRPYHCTLSPGKWEQVLKEIGCEQVVCTPAYDGVHGVFAARLSPRDEDGVKNGAIEHLEKFRSSWMIFYHDLNASVAELLQKKLIGVNRKVELVKRPSVCTEAGMKELMKSAFQLAGQEVERIEGVVYLWGLGDDDNGNRDQCQISLPLVNLLQEMTGVKNHPRIYVVTQGTVNVDGSQVTSPAAGTLHGIMKSLCNEAVGVHCSCLDLSPDDTPANQVGEIFSELWWTDMGNISIAFRESNRLLLKFGSGKVNYNEPLALPGGCDRFQLLLPKTRMISDLEFGVLENYSLKEDEIEVHVKAMALNFRDIFAVIKPIAQFEHLNAVGLDYSGVVTKVGSKVTHIQVGDRVIGMHFDDNLSLPSHILMEETCVVPLPSFITFEEGVTLPAVFSTAFHCLVQLAKMKRGDTVLIHTASGGVGLCAIQLAKLVGANIIATAGSKRKQTYLRNLGIKHIFHSRTTQFGKRILEVTNGRGVDIVLNSLTGEGFKEASLSALARGGFFIEMSKLNVWTPEEVKELRPDARYQIIDLTTLTRPEAKELFGELTEFLNAGKIRPIAYERFDALNVRGALNYMQGAKHIGKIVCVMPEVKVENSKIKAATPLFNEFSTYLVTGGLGGIGFEVVKWMLRSGAKHIAIVSRSQPKPEIKSQLEAWNRGGKHVEAFSVDIGDYSQCKKLFLKLASPGWGFPTIRGVMHVAGVLADAIIENQTWAKFQHTYNPKVNGTWNLHDLTKDFPMEHFVLFSSTAATLGTPGQSNHAASNSFEDALAAYRRSNGLPATTVNWANWGEVGVATEVDFPGVRPISTSQGILALETFLKTQTSHMNVLNLESFNLATKIIPNLKSFVDDKRLFGDLKTATIINSDEFWKDVDDSEDREGKLSVFKNFIKATLRNILKMDHDEVIDDLAEFQSLGIDSLMMLEMKNGLQNILGSRLVLTASQLKDCSNTDMLANRLVDVLEGEEGQSEVVLPTMEELQELVREDSTLPEHIRPMEGMEGKKLPSRSECVLLTGVTGTLGPYLLKELISRPNIKKIYCLIRKSGSSTPMERLLMRLKAIGLENQLDMAKVDCIQGDITQPKFGLSENEYNQLAENVDLIINSAVRSDHTAKYYASPATKKLDIRTVNVKATTRLLEFAVERKLKQLYHGSTLLTVTSTDEEGRLSEDWQDVGALDNLNFNMGYVLSKHISEQLCRQAVERGIPCKTFRFPYIAGDSETGRCDYLSNHIILRWLAYMKLGCMPDLPAPLVAIPVDRCAQLSLDIFLNPQAPPDVYNVTHKHGGMDQTLIEIAERFDIHIQPVTYSQFIEKLKSEPADSPLASFSKRYEEEEAMVTGNFELSPTLSCLQKYAEDSSNFFESRKLPQLIPYYDELESTADVLRRDVTFLKEAGVFENFGIR